MKLESVKSFLHKIGFLVNDSTIYMSLALSAHKWLPATLRVLGVQQAFFVACSVNFVDTLTLHILIKFVESIKNTICTIKNPVDKKPSTPALEYPHLRGNPLWGSRELEHKDARVQEEDRSCL